MQDLPRLYAETALADGARVPMTPGQAHYLGAVMRRAAGDPVLLFNGRDGEWRARIDALRRGDGAFLLEERVRPPAPEPGPVLLFAPLKRDATDLVVRLATELGASALQPVLTERTNTPRINAERFHSIAVEAAEQCERLSVPAVRPLRRLFDVLGGWEREEEGRVLLAAIEPWHEAGRQAGTVAAWRAGQGAEAAGRCAVLIGPEGGFTAAELDALRARPFVVPVSLGPRVLRADTAAAAALASLLG
jgi:16S rRNA (uracil1498-N3)-methyltransferase